MRWLMLKRMGWNEMTNVINLKPEEAVFGPPIEPVDDHYIKHVHCDGARFHVLHWSSNGTHCSEPNCIVNKR